MRTPEIISLPVAGEKHDIHNEQTMRRTVEQMFAAVRNDMIEIRDKTDREASLSMRRHQFLMMGASNG